MAKEPGRILVRGLTVLVVSGLAGAALVSLSPGFGLDEQRLDPRLAARSLESRERARDAERNPIAFYPRFVWRLFAADLGTSSVFGRPTAELLRERAPTTILTVTAGLAFGWFLALLLATGAALKRSPVTLLPALGVSGLLLSIPSAVLATGCLMLRLPPAAAIAGVVLPRVFPHAYEQLRAAFDAPHVIMARASGIQGIRLFVYYVLPTVLLPLLALAGVSVTLAFGAAIPVEALSDSPGIGQLAWRAALGRDLTVLVAVTLLLTGVTVVCGTVADLAIARTGRRRT